VGACIFEKRTGWRRRKGREERETCTNTYLVHWAV
jgi:hypothetical protein